MIIGRGRETLGTRAGLAVHQKGIIFDARRGHAGAGSIIIEDTDALQADECVSFLRTLRRLLTAMHKIQGRERQESCWAESQKKM